MTTAIAARTGPKNEYPQRTGTTAPGAEVRDSGQKENAASRILVQQQRGNKSEKSKHHKGYLKIVAERGCPIELAVAQAIIEVASPKNAAFARLDEIAMRADWSVSATRRAVRRLVGAGLLAHAPGNGRGLVSVFQIVEEVQ